VSEVLVAWNNFAVGLETGSPVLTLGVASYKWASFADVASISVSSFTGTQRRRQKQIG
jgi:hypothetical protein